MLANNVTLGAMRLQAQQRSDTENSPVISTPEWNQYLSQSYKELYDMLVAAYGNDYYVAEVFQFTTDGSQLYPLPDGTIETIGGDDPAPACYKLLGVDLQYSGAPSGFVSLRRFEMIERNKYAYPNTTINTNGYTNLRYRVTGSDLYLIPIPMSGQLVQLWYIPQPTSLQFQPPCSMTLDSTTIGMADVGDLLVGMSVSGDGIESGTVISSINTVANTIVISNAATQTKSYVTLSFWRDDTEINGIAGWEEYVIIDAAIKANIKQEQPIEELMAQKMAMKMRIEGMAEGRDAGQAQHVSDVLSINGYGDGDWGCGSGGYGGY